MLSASFKTVSIWIVFVLVGISKVQCRYKGLHCYNSNGFNNMTALEKVPCLEGVCIGAGWNLGKCVTPPNSEIICVRNVGAKVEMVLYLKK